MDATMGNLDMAKDLLNQRTSPAVNLDHSDPDMAAAIAASMAPAPEPAVNLDHSDIDPDMAAAIAASMGMDSGPASIAPAPEPIPSWAMADADLANSTEPPSAASTDADERLARMLAQQEWE